MEIFLMERPVQVLDCLLLVKVIKRGQIPSSHVSLLAAAQLPFRPSGTADRRDGDRELSDGHDLLRLSAGLRVGLVSLDPERIRVLKLVSDTFG